jgi:drug/metabolite transporter (DMT)-like permease
MEKLIGTFLATTSILAYAAMFPLLKKVNIKIPTFTLMALSMFFLFVFSLIGSLLFEKGSLGKFSVIKTYLPLLILTGLINVVAFSTEIIAYKYMPLWQQTMFTLLTPIFASILAYFILGEQISFKLFIGLVIMGAGLFIAIR